MLTKSLAEKKNHILTYFVKKTITKKINNGTQDNNPNDLSTLQKGQQDIL